MFELAYLRLIIARKVFDLALDPGQGGTRENDHSARQLSPERIQVGEALVRSQSQAPIP